MSTFRITPKGPFSLAASTRFLEGFAPASYGSAVAPGHLHLAFPVEGNWEVAGVCVRQTEKSVVGTILGDADRDAVRRQVARILSLDVDSSSFDKIGRRDRVVGRLQGTYQGLRPVLFWSPYEAAAWTIIGHRIRIVQAAAIKQRMAEQLGEKVDVHGEVLHAFPSPRRLQRLRDFPGLFGRKIEQLHTVAEAALEGGLDADHLRSEKRHTTLAQLKELPGIGDFSAELILVRGAGDPDHFPRNERRLQRAMADAYGFDDIPSVEALAEIAEKWRPFRSWISVLLRAELEDRTHEISGTQSQRRRSRT